MKGTDRTDFDTIVIGAGQAGPSLADVLDRRGERVALAQDGPFGGTCLNDGCRPTKAMRATAHAAHVARTADRLGVIVDGDVRVDLAAAVARKNTLIDTWRTSAVRRFEQHPTIAYIPGRARLNGIEADGRIAVTVDASRLFARRVVLNTGARSVPPTVDGIDTIEWLDHHSLLDVTDLPSHLVVLGGSYIGLEFGQMFHRFGSNVTIIERSEHIISREDPEISDAITEFLRDEGVTILTGRTVNRIEPAAPGSNAAHLYLDDGKHLAASHVLIAAGRRPNSDDLGLDTVGVNTDDHGYIEVDDVFRTNIDGIYAVGDVNGRGAFTHTSYQDYEILADHLAGGSRAVTGRIETYALFTDPPLGRYGITERDAASRNTPYVVVTYPMNQVTRAVLDGEPAGLVKLVADPDNGRLLGAAILGTSGDEVVQTLSLLDHAGGTIHDLATWLPVHPTITEFLPTIAAGLTPPG